MKGAQDQLSMRHGVVTDMLVSFPDPTLCEGKGSGTL